MYILPQIPFINENGMGSGINWVLKKNAAARAWAVSKA